MYSKVKLSSKILSVFLAVALVFGFMPTRPAVAAPSTGNASDLAVNASWSSKSPGEEITVGSKTYIYGTTAFSQMKDAVGKVTTTPANITVYGNGNVGTAETETGEGTEFTVAGNYNITGTEFANLGYLQLNPSKTVSATRYVANIDDSSLVLTKPQLRISADLNITNSHTDFANQSGASRGYLFAFKDSKVNVNNSVVGYNTSQGNSSSIVAGKTSTNTLGNMSTYISGIFEANNSTVYTVTSEDGKADSFAIYDRGLGTFKNSVLYSGNIKIGAFESDKTDRETLGRDGQVATLQLDNSKVISNNSDSYALTVGNSKDGKLIMKNGSTIDYSTVDATVNTNGTVEIDATSKINVNKMTNNGKIVVDMTGATAPYIKLIDSKATGSNYGTYEFATGKGGDYTLKVIDGDLYAVHSTAANKIAVNSAWSDKQKGEEVETGYFYGINAFSTAAAASSAVTSGITEIVAYGNNTSLGALTISQDLKLSTKNTDTIDAKFDNITVASGKTLSITGGSKINSAAVNNSGKVTVEGTVKLSSANWNGDMDVKNATLTTDGFTQKSGKFQAFGTSKLTNFSLYDVRVGYETGSTLDDTLNIAGDNSKINTLYLGQDSAAWTGRIYKLNIAGKAEIGSAGLYVRQNGQLNLDKADVTTGYNCIYGAVNIMNASKYTVNNSNFYVSGRVSSDKMAKDRAVITVNNSTLDFTKTFGLEISDGLGSNPYKGSGKLILQNGAIAKGSMIWLGNNTDGSLGTIAVESTDSTIDLTGKMTIGQGDTLAIDKKSPTIKANSFVNNGTITVDMTGATDGNITLIESKTAPTFGTYKFAEGKDFGYRFITDKNCLIATNIPDCAENVTTGKPYNDLNYALSDCKSGQTVKLLRDVELKESWKPITDFQGTFDGNNKTISGLKINGTNNLGLFAQINGGCVKDFTISGAKITAGALAENANVENIGIVAGYGYGDKIDNVTIKDSTIESAGKYVGGIVGLSYISVTNCKLENVKVNGKEQVGGLVGYSACGFVNNNTLTGINVKATTERAGGLIGKLQCDVGNASEFKYNNNKIVKNETYGQNTVQAPDMAGGIAGQIMGNMSNYQISNNEIDIALTSAKTSPIGILRHVDSSSCTTTFTGVLAQKITGNTWTKSTYNLTSYTYSAEVTGASIQVINRKPTQLTVTGTTVEDKLYDGTTEADITLGEVSGVVTGDVVEVSFSGEFTNADANAEASVPVTYTLSGTDKDWYAAPEAETLTAEISKRSVIITSASASKIYDGEPLTANEVTESGDGFIKGQGATYEVTGTQTEPGKSLNTFTYTLNEGTKADNYEITKVEGTLSVSYVTNGTFYIAASNAPLQVIDVEGGSKDNGAKVQLYGANQTAAQKWTIEIVDDGYVIIKNASGKVLDVAGASAKAGTKVWQYTPNGTKAQLWMPEINDDNTVTFKSALDESLVLDLTAGSTANGTNVQIYTANGTAAQKFNLYNLNPIVQPSKSGIEDGYYSIQSKINSGYYVDLDGGKDANGTNIHLWSGDGKNNDNQIFFFHKGEDGFYTITNCNTGKAIDVSAACVLPGTNVQQWEQNGTAAQKWDIVKNGENDYTFLNVGTGLVMDVNAGVAANGQNIQGYIDNGSKAQRWGLTQADPTKVRLDKLADENRDVLKDGMMYTFENVKDDTFAIDVAGGSKDSGASVQLYTNNNTNAQKWIVTHDEKGYITFTNAGSGKVMDAAGAQGVTGTKIWQYEDNGTRAQKWIAVPATKDNAIQFRIVSALSDKLQIGPNSIDIKDSTGLCLVSKTHDSAALFTSRYVQGPMNPQSIVCNISGKDTAFLPAYKGNKAPCYFYQKTGDTYTKIDGVTNMASLATKIGSIENAKNVYVDTNPYVRGNASGKTFYATVDRAWNNTFTTSTTPSTEASGLKADFATALANAGVKTAYPCAGAGLYDSSCQGFSGINGLTTTAPTLGDVNYADFQKDFSTLLSASSDQVWSSSVQSTDNAYYFNTSFSQWYSTFTGNGYAVAVSKTF